MMGGLCALHHFNGDHMDRRLKKFIIVLAVYLLLPPVFDLTVICLSGVINKAPGAEPIFSSAFAAEKRAASKNKSSSENSSEREEEVSGDLNDSPGDRSTFNVTADGFIEIENYYSTARGMTQEERNLKNELRANLEIKAGWENVYLFSKTNFYYTPRFRDEKDGNNYYYSNERRVSDNLMLSGKEYEIEPSELYLNMSNSLFRFRAGNQIFLWGTADLYNPTSYFNPADYREYVFADEDELKLAVPSGSLMVFLKSVTVEMVFVPVHIPSELPPDGNYWQIQSDSSLLALHIDKNKGMDRDISNSAYGIRTSFSPGGVDFSLSYFHGPDRTPVFVPKYVNYLATPYQLEVEPEYFIVNKFGFDFSTQLSDFVIQCEAVYSPDKTWLVEREFTEFMKTNMVTRSSFETEKSHYVHYAAGFNYYIPVGRLIDDYEGESIITAEWQQPWYSNDELMKPVLSKILLLRFEEICFDSRLKVSVSYLTELNKRAHVVKPEIKYDFQNGLSFKVSYLYISAKSDNGATSILSDEDTSLLYYLKDKDMGTFTVRYDFQ